jgi:uncharacterized protein (TIGR02001 family)
VSSAGKWMAGLLFLVAATPAAAQVNIGGGFTVRAEAAATTDYRFRGISQTDGDPALQASGTIDHSSGLYVGGFASTLKDDTRPGEIELSGYVGYTREILPSTDIDIGVQLYGYPNNGSLTDASYFEPYASLRHTLGPVTAEVGAAYAPEQDALAGQDSLYVYADASAGLFFLPVTVTARVGYTSGPARFTGFSDFLDWRVGAEYRLGPATFALEYVDTDLPSVPDADATLVASLRVGF